MLLAGQSLHTDAGFNEITDVPLCLTQSCLDQLWALPCGCFDLASTISQVMFSQLVIVRTLRRLIHIGLSHIEVYAGVVVCEVFMGSSIVVGVDRNWLMFVWLVILFTYRLLYVIYSLRELKSCSRSLWSRWVWKSWMYMNIWFYIVRINFHSQYHSCFRCLVWSGCEGF